jgi:site-specific DNA-methyltransferase (adenine-specific)
MNIIHYSSNTNEWATPQDFFDILDNEFRFTLDPCATHKNHKCEKYYTIDDDGLAKSWLGETVFMNPPYGRVIKHWVKKAHDEAKQNGATVVALIPARTDTRYWHEYIHNIADIRFLKGRLKFGDATTSAPFPSAVVVWGAGEPTYRTMEAAQRNES